MRQSASGPPGSQQPANFGTLHAISAAIVSSLDPDTVLHRVLGLTCEALDAAEGSILLRDRATGELVFAITRAGERDSLSGQRLAPGQGIAGWIAEHGCPACVNDVERDPRYYDGMVPLTGIEVHTLLGVPMFYHDQVVGVIEIINKRTGGFSDADLGFLQTVASFAAVALENARLYTATRQRADELALLNSIGLALTSTLDPSTVIVTALSQVARLFQADHVSLIQPDPESGALRFTCALERGEPVEIPVTFPASRGVAGWAIEHAQPVLVGDAHNDPRFYPGVDQQLGFSTRSLMAAPLVARDKTLGVLEVVSDVPHLYSPQQLDTLQALASTLAVALENATLYEELRSLLREREQAQVALIHTEKMAALGRLVASIAHEINNPLQAVQGCLTLLREELDGGLRLPEMKRYLSVADGELRRVAAIVARMREFYRPARRVVQPTDIHEVIESVLTLTNKQMQHSRVVVERDWAEGLPLCEINPDHLKQVFLNLVLNALDAMPEGGVLRVSTAPDRLVPVRGGAPREAVRIEFTDTGSGIPPEVMARLFEPFLTTKEQGSGLGLSVSYSIIQAHHGHISVKSQPGAGSTFTILLPVRQPATRGEGAAG
jgi:signal transduction histidine kinase